MPEGVFLVGGFAAHLKTDDGNDVAPAVGQVVHAVGEHGDHAEQRPDGDLSRGEQGIERDAQDPRKFSDALAGGGRCGLFALFYQKFCDHSLTYASFDGRVADFRLDVCRFQLEDDGAQPVVARTDGDARRADPVAVIEQFPAAPVREGEHILVNGFPRLVAQPLRFGVVGVEHLPLAQHGAAGQPLDAVFPCQVLLQGFPQNGYLHFFHSIEYPPKGLLTPCGGFPLCSRKFAGGAVFSAASLSVWRCPSPIRGGCARRVRGWLRRGRRGIRSAWLRSLCKSAPAPPLPAP